MNSQNISVLIGAMPAIPHLPLLIPVAAGVVAGFGVVGAIHFLIRPRKSLRPPQPKKDAAAVPDPFVHGSSGELRKSFRREGNPVEVLIVNQQTKAPPFKGYVINRSVGGLGLLTEEMLEEGTQLSVKTTNATQMTPWIEVVVRSRREVTPGWEVGCQFLKTPPWSVLLMFG